MDIQLGGVEKTLLMPLYGRAKLSKENNPLFTDNMAVEIIDKLNFDFSAIDEHTPYAAHINYALRAKIIDNSIIAFLERHPEAAIINLGAGLDTTFFRIDNNLIAWYDIDLPGVIELRNKLIPETQRSKSIKASIFDTDWMNRIEPAKHILFICVGVLEYFNHKQVISFLIKLAESFPGSEIIFNTTSNNIVNSYLVKYGMKKMDIEVCPTEMGNIIKSVRHLKDKMSVIEYYPLAIRAELKDCLDKKTFRQLKIFYLLTQTRIIHLKSVCH